MLQRAQLRREWDALRMPRVRAAGSASAGDVCVLSGPREHRPKGLGVPGLPLGRSLELQELSLQPARDDSGGWHVLATRLERGGGGWREGGEERGGGGEGGSVCRQQGAASVRRREEDEGLSLLPPDRALRANVGAAWQGVACWPCPPTPEGTRTDSPALAGPRPAGPLSAGGDSAPARCAGSCGAERAGDDSDAARREESPRVSWAPAPITVLLVGCDFRGGSCAWGL